MYDLRILLVWFILGFLLYMITMRPDSESLVRKQRQKDKLHEELTNPGWERNRPGTESKLVKRLRETNFVEKFNPDQFVPADHVRSVIPRSLVVNLGVYPLRVDGDILVLAMLDPFDLDAVTIIRDLTGKEIKTVKISFRDFKQVAGVKKSSS